MIKSLYPSYQYWSQNGSVWIISDTHFNDPDCNFMSPNWPTPRKHIEIIKHYVHKNDTLIHLGDVGDPEWIKEIPGYKVLVLGNHDQSVSKYKDYFNEIYTGPLMIGEKILLSHEPIYGNDWCVNLHGHDHSPLNTGDSHHKNFAANVVGYIPISLGNLIKNGILSPITGIHRITIDNAIKKKKEKEIDIYDMNWVHDDITWCNSECRNTNCYRNLANRQSKERVFTVSDFKGTGECPIESEGTI